MALGATDAGDDLRAVARRLEEGSNAAFSQIRDRCVHIRLCVHPDGEMIHPPPIVIVRGVVRVPVEDEYFMVLARRDEKATLDAAVEDRLPPEKTDEVPVEGQIFRPHVERDLREVAPHGDPPSLASHSRRPPPRHDGRTYDRKRQTSFSYEDVRG